MAATSTRGNETSEGSRANNNNSDEGASSSEVNASAKNAAVDGFKTLFAGSLEGNAYDRSHELGPAGAKAELSCMEGNSWDRP